MGNLHLCNVSYIPISIPNNFNSFRSALFLNFYCLITYTICNSIKYKISITVQMLKFNCVKMY